MVRVLQTKGAFYGEGVVGVTFLAGFCLSKIVHLGRIVVKGATMALPPLIVLFFLTSSASEGSALRYPRPEPRGSEPATS